MNLPLHLLVVCILGCAAPSMAAAPVAELDADQRLNAWVREGLDKPRRALAQIDAMTGPADARSLALARGLINAANGLAAEANASVQALERLAPTDPLAAASALLVQATLAAQEGFGARAAIAAQAALDSFGPPCDAGKPPPACDAWSAWRARHLIVAQALLAQRLLDAQTTAQQSLNTAKALAKVDLEVSSLLDLALAAAHRRDREAATQAMTAALRLVDVQSVNGLSAAVALTQYEVAAALADPAPGAREFQDALRVIGTTGERRPRALLQLRRAEGLTEAGHWDEAMKLVAVAEPVLSATGDRRAVHRAMEVRGVVRIRRGDVATGRRDLNEVQAFWRATESDSDLVRTLRAHGVALAEIGDAPAALALFHQERSVSAELIRANLAATQNAVKASREEEAQRREQELLARDNSIKAEALANAEQTQRIILLVIAVLALSGALVALLYRRVRQANRQLVASRSRLQRASERDPLTDLANRRHLQRVMTQLGADTNLRGAMLLVDIDHFKNVNDTHGHARGDEVIVEIARRLTRAVRAGEWVARWGGEEFLLFSRGASAQHAEQMAQRILSGVRDAPIGDLAVTVSLGFASFPLPPHQTRIGWELALAMVDGCLYAAKRGGRDRAVGLVWTDADSDAGLRAVAADMVAATAQGRVKLQNVLAPTG